MNEYDPVIIWERVRERTEEATSDICRALGLYRGEDAFVVFDTETTGFSPARGARIIEVAFHEYRIRDGELEEQGDLVSHVDPRMPIPYRITELTRITEQHVRGKPLIGDVIPDISAFIGKKPVVGHNVNFDLRFLNPEMEQRGYMPLPKERVLDTLKISRDLYGMKAGHSLGKCANREGVGIFDCSTYHSASHDARVTAEVFVSMLRKIADGGHN